MSDTAIIAIPVVLSLIAGAIGWRTIHKRVYALFWSTFGLIAVVTAGLYAAAVTVSGWEAIAYLALMIVGSLPATVALLLGGGIGLITQRRMALPS